LTIIRGCATCAVWVAYGPHIILRFYLRARTAKYFEGYVDAFCTWGVSTRVCW